MSSIDAITAQISQTQMDIAQSVLKLSTQADQQMAAVLEQASNTVPVSGRGGNVNITV